MPDMRYVSVADPRFLTASPTDRIDVNSTPSATGVMYGDCVVLGPTSDAGAIATDTATANARTRSTVHLLMNEIEAHCPSEAGRMTRLGKGWVKGALGWGYRQLPGTEPGSKLQ